jgi:hypothetical protein
LLMGAMAILFVALHIVYRSLEREARNLTGISAEAPGGRRV